MKRLCGFTLPKRWLVLLVFLFPMLSCTTIKEAIWPPTATPTPTVTPTATPTSTSTPTSFPIAQRDLSKIALQQSDLPGGYTETVIPNIAEALAEAGGDAAEIVLENLEKDYGVLFMGDTESLYMNMILVYTDEDSSGTVYSFFAASLMAAGTTVDIPQIGNISIGAEYSESGITAYEIIWLYDEAVIELQYMGVDDLGMDELVRLARIIQARFEAE